MIPGIGYSGWRRRQPGHWEAVANTKAQTKAEAFNLLMLACELAGHASPMDRVEYLILPADEQPRPEHYEPKPQRLRR